MGQSPFFLVPSRFTEFRSVNFPLSLVRNMSLYLRLNSPLCCSFLCYVLPPFKWMRITARTRYKCDEKKRNYIRGITRFVVFLLHGDMHLKESRPLPTFLKRIILTACSLQCSWTAGAYCSCQCVRDRVQPGEVTSLSQGWHIETTQSHTISAL